DLKAQLEELDQKLETTISEGKHKEILVSHAAYGYWEKRYGLTQISVAGLSPTNEPSQKQLQSIIKEANEHNIKYFIFDQNLEPKV
ncbi:zinc ABC transporter substrate-binding protein, partial [Escherichia coli]|nr:zinc ABC transporter substrate-binding protein [Escherichia coli]